MRLMRWMMIGELTRAPPTTMLAGLRNSSSIAAGLYRGFPGHPAVEELGQHGVEVVASADQRVVDPLAGAAAADLHQVLLQRLQVAVAQGARVAQEVGQLLHPLETGGAGERE